MIRPAAVRNLDTCDVVDIAVVICDERPAVRRSLRAVLEAEAPLAVIAEVADCRRVPSVADRMPSPVVVLPTDPAVDESRLVSEFPSLSSAAGVVVLVPDIGPDQLATLVRLGARGVLYLDDVPVELVRAVRMVAADGAYLSSRVTGHLVDGLRHDGWLPHPRSSVVMERLTGRELQIFRLIVEGRTNNEIARVLFISEATVKSHFNRICKKLGIENRVQAVIMAHELDMITY